MKELIAAFSTEIFRPVITLLIPGIWGLAFASIAMFLREPVAWSFVLAHTTACSIVFLTASTALGMILENLGGEVENAFFLKLGHQAKHDWYRYLSLALSPEPVAFSYMRTYVMRLKFEAGMYAGCYPAAAGLLFLPIHWASKTLLTIVILLLARYFRAQVKSSVEELAHVRQSLFLYFPFSATTKPRPPRNIKE